MFNRIYQYILDRISHPHAEKYLYGLSFCESSFFPVPPDIMLAPMCAVSPQHAIRYGLWTTFFSVLGGLLGYAIGFFFFALFNEWLMQSNYWEDYLKAVSLFQDWGGFAVFVSAFSPIPYKVFTVSAGVLEQNLFIFATASVLGRGLRFMLVALLLRWMGPKVLPYIERWVPTIGWLTVILLAIAIIWSTL